MCCVPYYQPRLETRGRPPRAFCDQGVGQRVAVPGWCLIKQNCRQMEDFLPPLSHFFPSFCSTPQLLLDLGGLHCLDVLELTCLNNKSTPWTGLSRQLGNQSINWCQLQAEAREGPPSSRPPFPTSKPAAAQAAGSSELHWLPFQGLEAGPNPGRKEQGGSVRFLQSWG